MRVMVAPSSGVSGKRPVSGSANCGRMPLVPASAAGTTRRNFSPSSMRTMPLSERTSRIARRYSSSVRGESGVVRSVIVTLGVAGDGM